MPQRRGNSPYLALSFTTRMVSSRCSLDRRQDRQAHHPCSYSTSAHGSPSFQGPGARADRTNAKGGAPYRIRETKVLDPPASSARIYWKRLLPRFREGRRGEVEAVVGARRHKDDIARRAPRPAFGQEPFAAPCPLTAIRGRNGPFAKAPKVPSSANGSHNKPPPGLHGGSIGRDWERREACKIDGPDKF